MTETIEPWVLDDTENKMARAMVAQARQTGVGLVGPDGLLAGLTKQVLELALEEEFTEHLGYESGGRDAKVVTNERCTSPLTLQRAGARCRRRVLERTSTPSPSPTTQGTKPGSTDEDGSLVGVGA